MKAKEICALFEEIAPIEIEECLDSGLAILK